jgi:hypothetical protein
MPAAQVRVDHSRALAAAPRRAYRQAGYHTTGKVGDADAAQSMGTPAAKPTAGAAPTTTAGRWPRAVLTGGSAMRIALGANDRDVGDRVLFGRVEFEHYLNHFARRNPLAVTEI